MWSVHMQGHISPPTFTLNQAANVCPSRSTDNPTILRPMLASVSGEKEEEGLRERNGD